MPDADTTVRRRAPWVSLAIGLLLVAAVPLVVSTAAAQSVHPDFSLTQLHTGLGQIAQMTFGPDDRLYVATTGSTATGGVFRFDYDPVGGLSNQTKVSNNGSTSVAFHQDSAAGRTYMYLTDVPNIFVPGTPAPGIMRRLTDSNDDGTWGGGGDINQVVVNTIPIVGQHRMNQIQIEGDSLYVGIGSLTTNGLNESAHTGIGWIEDLTLLSNTATPNVAGLAGPFTAGSNGTADISPFTSTDPGRIRFHSGGLRNAYGIGFDPDGALWITMNEDQGSGPGGSTLGDKLYRGDFQADYGFPHLNPLVNFKNSATVEAAGFYTTAPVPPTADLGPHAAVGGVDFTANNDFPLPWHKHAIIPRWVFNDVAAVDTNTGEVTQIVSGINRALEAVRDPIGNILLGEAPNDSEGTPGRIYRLGGRSTFEGARKFAWTASAGSSVWSDRLAWDADFDGDGVVDPPFAINPADKLVPTQWGTQKYDVTINTSLDFNVTVDRDVWIDSLTLADTLSISSGRQLTVDTSAALLPTGELTGTGSFVANGVFAPHAGADAASFGGDIAFGDAAILALNIGGTTTGSFDSLQLAGHFISGGVVNVTFADGYRPDVADTFEVITAGQLLGTFDHVAVVDGSGIFLTPTYTGTTLTLTVDQTLTPGDLNGDYLVNDSDIFAFAAGWLHMQEFGDIESLRKGDLNQDGNTDLFDWQILRVNHPNGPALNLATYLAVPEPATESLALVLLLGVAVSRSRLLAESSMRGSSMRDGDNRIGLGNGAGVTTTTHKRDNS